MFRTYKIHLGKNLFIQQQQQMCTYTIITHHLTFRTSKFHLNIQGIMNIHKLQHSYTLNIQLNILNIQQNCYPVETPAQHSSKKRNCPLPAHQPRPMQAPQQLYHKLQIFYHLSCSCPEREIEDKQLQHSDPPEELQVPDYF